MADNLFGPEKDLSRSDKMRISRKVTTDLTKKVIDFLNDSQQFQVHRSNNFPSPRITKVKTEFKYIDHSGNAQVFEYEDVKIHFKKYNIKEAILDISGFVLPYNGNDDIAGHHVEIEVKTKKDTLSDEQIKRIADVKGAGGISFVFDTFETFMIQIKPYMKEKLYAF